MKDKIIFFRDILSKKTVSTVVFFGFRFTDAEFFLKIKLYDLFEKIGFSIEKNLSLMQF